MDFGLIEQNALVVVLINALLIVAILHIATFFVWLRSSEDIHRKMLWFIIAINLPVIGPVLYLYTHQDDIPRLR